MTLSASLQYELVTCPVLQCFIHRIILVASNIKTQGISEAFRKQDIWQNVVEGSSINEKIEYPHNQKSSCRRLPSSSYSLSATLLVLTKGGKWCRVRLCIGETLYHLLPTHYSLPYHHICHHHDHHCQHDETKINHADCRWMMMMVLMMMMMGIKLSWRRWQHLV